MKVIHSKFFGTNKLKLRALLLGPILFSIVLLVYFLPDKSDDLNLNINNVVTTINVSTKFFNGFDHGKSVQSDKLKCANILKNITVGRWSQLMYKGVEEDLKALDGLHRSFRTSHEGFSRMPYRNDQKCGFSVPYCAGFCLGSIKLDASAWCDHKSATPCCTDRYNGKCVSEDQCKSLPDKVNLAKYTHPEVAKWKPEDERCQYVLYKQDSACELMEKQQIKSIGFIGNSLLKNFYAAMLQLLTNNFYNGTVVEKLEPYLKKKCVNQIQHMDPQCGGKMAPDSNKLPKPGICGGKVNTFMYMKAYYIAVHGKLLEEHVKSLLGKEGTYLLIGIGLHDSSNSQKVTRDYLKPAFEIRKGQEWPKILWVHTTTSGIFKPVPYIAMHGDDTKIDKFNKDVEDFCNSYGVPSINFRMLTTGVWSQDGQHYGTGLNLMKVHLFLNILASDQVFV